MIIAGWSAYPRQLDFARFRSIADEVGAYLMVAMAHFAGLVAAGLHPNPMPHAHVTTSTTHKTLGGPLRPDPDRRPDSRQEDRLCARTRAAGVRVLPAGPTSTSSWSTLIASALDGKPAEDRLHDIGITVNRDAVPNDPRPPMVTSGLRIGTAASATRGLQAVDFAEVADVIAAALRESLNDSAAACVTGWGTGRPIPLYPALGGRPWPDSPAEHAADTVSA
jgi:glycine hydroxymethyltransferase